MALLLKHVVYRTVSCMPSVIKCSFWDRFQGHKMQESISCRDITISPVPQWDRVNIKRQIYYNGEDLHACITSGPWWNEDTAVTGPHCYNQDKAASFIQPVTNMDTDKLELLTSLLLRYLWPLNVTCKLGIIHNYKFKANVF